MDQPGPPSIAYLRGMGVRALWATCGHAHCLRSKSIEIEALGIDESLTLAQALRRLRFVCSRCGSRNVGLTPDWRNHLARGNGKGFVAICDKTSQRQIRARAPQDLFLRHHDAELRCSSRVRK